MTALAVTELALRPFASPMRADARPPTYLTPRGDGRQYQEGVSSVHYFPDGARRTGEPRLPSAPSFVILGDSQIEATQVDDDETMGAVIERRARAAHTPLNVVQIGWGGAGIPTYLGVASNVLSTWPTDHVVIVLNPRDFGSGALLAGNFKMTIASDGSASVKDVGHRPSTSRIKRVMQHSSLASMVWLRGKQMWSSAREQDLPDGAPQAAANVEKLVAASVHALHASYGERLAIVYTPYIGVVDDPATPDEALLLQACSREHVPCVSARDAMRTARDVDHVLCRGFHNTVPGIGHFNADGHEVMASVIWHLVFDARRGS